MSSILGARAISMVMNGQVTERPHARVFLVKDYTVVIGGTTTIGQDVCTCQAGQRGVSCSHVRAAHLLIARERDQRGDAA